MVGNRFFQGLYYDNLGISLSSGTFTIHGADGRDLSTSNPAVVVLRSKSNAGQFVRYEITANQSFDDASAAGGSDITGNLFGTDTTRAWDPAGGMPFYIYAVANDNESVIQFMIARIPHVLTSPTAGSIGAPDDPVADSDISFWSLSNIDETVYDGNPCASLGSFRMSKDTSDDWTVETITTNLARQDGIGFFNEQAVFVYQTNQNGAASGTHLRDNGGTAPTFTTNVYNYQINRMGILTLTMTQNGNTATDGAGAVQAQVTTPISISNSFPTLSTNLGMLATDSSVDGTTYKVANSSAGNPYFSLSNGLSTMQNADFGDAQRALQGQLQYLINT